MLAVEYLPARSGGISNRNSPKHKRRDQAPILHAEANRTSLYKEEHLWV